MHSSPDTHAAGNQPAVGHLVPWQLLLAVCAALLVLTYITVAVFYVNLGEFNLWIAMTIATIKATLVIMYFMHLRYDRPFNALVLTFSLLFMLLFVGLVLADSVAYHNELTPPTAKEYAPENVRGKQ